MDATCTILRAWALHFAARGWHVFPITPGAKKPPVIDRWETRASTNPDQIHRWWQVPYTIGIATGPSGLVVIDLDTPKPREIAPDRWATLGIRSGVGVLRALARQHDTTVTPTYAVTTPSGGWHLYYTAPLGPGCQNAGSTTPGTQPPRSCCCCRSQTGPSWRSWDGRTPRWRRGTSTSLRPSGETWRSR